MPISRYQIRNVYSLADPELYKAADKDDPEALLEGVAMAGLVGVLRQLGDLAEFAAEVFHGLHEEVMATASRGHGLLTRVQQLESELPSVERAFLSQTSYSAFFPNPGIEWHPNRQTEQNLITKGDLPRFVMDSYEECRGPPRLFLLDKFDVAGAGACLKRYTDPSFYKAEAASYETASAETQRDKKVRKTKKKGSRWKGGGTHEISQPSHKLHQLFLEERVQNGAIEPQRRVQLKKRPNKFPFDSENGNQYMEKLLNSPSEDKLVHEVPLCSSTLKSPAYNSKESRLKTPEGSVVISPSNVDLGHHEEVYEKHIAVDSESRTEGLQDGYKSDDIVSETDNYVDALATMEPELETDAEFRARIDPNTNQETISESNVEQLQSQYSQSIENSYSESTCTSSENTPPQAFACTEIPFRPRISPNEDSDEKISVTQHPDQEILIDSSIMPAIDALLSLDEEEILQESNEILSNNEENPDSPRRVSSNRVSNEKISMTQHPDQEILNDCSIMSAIDAPLSADEEEILQESNGILSNNEENLDSPTRVSSNRVSNEKIPLTPDPDQEILNDSCIRSAIDAPLPMAQELLEESNETSSSNGENLDSPVRLSSNQVSDENISMTPYPDQEILNDSQIRSAVDAPLPVAQELLEESYGTVASNGENLDSPRRVSSNQVSDEKISVTPHPDQEVLNDSHIRSAVAAPLPVDEEGILEESNELTSNNSEYLDSPTRLPSNEVSNEKISVTPHPDQEISNVSWIRSSIDSPLHVDQEKLLEESNEMLSNYGEDLDKPRRISSDQVSDEKISVIPHPDQEILNDSCMRSAIAAPLPVDEEEILEESNEMGSKNGENLDTPRKTEEPEVEMEVNLDHTSKLSDVLQTADNLSSSSSLRDDKDEIDNEHPNNVEDIISHLDVNPSVSTLPEAELKEIGDETVHVSDSPEAKVSYSSNGETDLDETELEGREIESVRGVFTFEDDRKLKGREADSVNLENDTGVDHDENEDNDLSSNEQMKQSSVESYDSDNRSADLKILEDQSCFVLEETDQNGVEPVVLSDLDSQPNIASNSTEADHVLESKSLDDHVDIFEAERPSLQEEKIDQVKPFISGFDMLPQLAPVNLEETPPLPPLPPMQWRMRKLQNSSLTHHDHFPPIDTENQKPQHVYEEHNLLEASEAKTSENIVPQPSVETEHSSSVLETSEQKTLSLNPPSLPPNDDERPNCIRPMKIHRPRSPLIDAVAAHDKSKLRKVSERATSQIQKEEESDNLLEQIRAKSFNLKRAIQTRPSIQGPRTNLRVAAILEKASAIRQAFVGSDDDDDDDSDSWSD